MVIEQVIDRILEKIDVMDDSSIGDAEAIIGKILDGKIQTSLGMIKHFQQTRLSEIHRKVHSH